MVNGASYANTNYESLPKSFHFYWVMIDKKVQRKKMMCIEELYAIAIEIGSNFINETGCLLFRLEIIANNFLFKFSMKSVSLPTWILAIATWKVELSATETHISTLQGFYTSQRIRDWVGWAYEAH